MDNQIIIDKKFEESYFWVGAELRRIRAAILWGCTCNILIAKALKGQTHKSQKGK